MPTPLVSLSLEKSRVRAGWRVMLGELEIASGSLDYCRAVVAALRDNIAHHPELEPARVVLAQQLEGWVWRHVPREPHA